jgi:hypothetical protein
MIRSKGDQALFGGFSTNDMKKKLGVPAENHWLIFYLHSPLKQRISLMN